MTPRPFIRLALCVLVVASVASMRAPTPRVVYISATDAKGAPVTDLVAADISVKEGGKDQAIVGLEPATAALDVVVLVSDNGTGVFQPGAFQFFQSLLGHGKFSMSQFTPQVAQVMDFTDDVSTIQAALGRITPRGKVEGSGEQLIDAIAQSARTLQQRKAARPVILVLTVSGESEESLNPQPVLNQVRMSGAMLNVVFFTGAGTGQVLGDGPKQFGGRSEEVHAPAGVGTAITRITDTLLHQYVLTYSLPDGVKPADRLSVSTSRKGVTLLAPTRIADK
jgi:hypothetical protein